MRPYRLGAIAAGVVLALTTSTSARAAEIWDGDASQGTGVFHGLDCVSPGSVTTTTDSSHGSVFVYDKPAGDPRCESRGIKVDGSAYSFAEDSTYYIGWQTKMSSVTGDFVVWQWKSYPNSEQNYPLIMNIKDGTMRLFYVTPNDQDWITVWSAPVTAGSWNKYALAIHTSTDASAGWVQVWFNGTQQTLLGNTTRYYGRTWDSANEPKWGVYDSDDGSTAITNTVDGQKIGTTYADVS